MTFSILLDELGDVPSSLWESISAQTKEETLRLWYKQAAKAESIKEFAKKAMTQTSLS